MKMYLQRAVEKQRALFAGDGDNESVLDSPAKSMWGSISMLGTKLTVGATGLLFVLSLHCLCSYKFCRFSAVLKKHDKGV